MKLVCTKQVFFRSTLFSPGDVVERMGDEPEDCFKPAEEVQQAPPADAGEEPVTLYDLQKPKRKPRASGGTKIAGTGGFTADVKPEDLDILS
jgi:hypothetical protein